MENICKIENGMVKRIAENIEYYNRHEAYIASVEAARYIVETAASKGIIAETAENIKRHIWNISDETKHMFRNIVKDYGNEGQEYIERMNAAWQENNINQYVAIMEDTVNNFSSPADNGIWIAMDIVNIIYYLSELYYIRKEYEEQAEQRHNNTIIMTAEQRDIYDYVEQAICDFPTYRQVLNAIYTDYVSGKYHSALRNTQETLKVSTLFNVHADAKENIEAIANIFRKKIIESARKELSDIADKLSEISMSLADVDNATGEDLYLFALEFSNVAKHIGAKK